MNESQIGCEAAGGVIRLRRTWRPAIATRLPAQAWKTDPHLTFGIAGQSCHHRLVLDGAETIRGGERDSVGPGCRQWLAASSIAATWGGLRCGGGYRQQCAGRSLRERQVLGTASRGVFNHTVRSMYWGTWYSAVWRFSAALNSVLSHLADGGG